MGTGSKKRKRDVQKETTSSNGAPDPVDTTKPTAIFKPRKGRKHTVSIALPGSIVANAQTHDQKTALAGSIARACAVFCVDEVVIFSDDAPSSAHDRKNSQHAAADAESGYNAFADPARFLAHLLSYLETPPHLRRVCFPHHPDLRTAGSLPSLDMPHHLKREEWCHWREGVVTGSATGVSSATNGTKPKKSKTETHSEASSAVDTGLPNPVAVDVALEPGTRVTVRFDQDTPPASSTELLRASAVRPEEPREEGGYYWGFDVRQVESISAVLTDAPWGGGYDYCIGTSERGKTLKTYMSEMEDIASDASDSQSSLQWNHLLIVLGGVAGLEKAVKHDAVLAEKQVTDPQDLFDAYLNLVPEQGSRTIRTEEALWCALMGLQQMIAMTGA